MLINNYLRIIHVCEAILIHVIIPTENGCATPEILINQVILSSDLSLSLLNYLPYELLWLDNLRQWRTYSTKYRRSKLGITRKLIHRSSIFQIQALRSHSIVIIDKLYILEKMLLSAPLLRRRPYVKHLVLGSVQGNIIISSYF